MGLRLYLRAFLDMKAYNPRASAQGSIAGLNNQGSPQVGAIIPAGVKHVEVLNHVLH